MEKKGALTNTLESMGINSLLETDFQLEAMLRDRDSGHRRREYDLLICLCLLDLLICL